MKTINVVAAILIRDHKVFATQRGYGAYKGWWEFPGGKIEPGEDSRGALIREIREELDTEISVGGILDTVEYDYPEFHLSMDCYLCKVLSGSLTLLEHEDASWLSVAELDSVKWLPADLELISDIRDILQGRIGMNLKIVPCEEKYLPAAVSIWNEVVEEGTAFPQEEPLDEERGRDFFGSQSHCAVAVDGETDEVYGLYILHPNNVGRCGHICNASFAVRSDLRGQHIGEQLVKDCLVQAGGSGFRILQFNAVVETNIHARHLYERLGFRALGPIPGGFRMPDGQYATIIVYYHVL